jgi:hypothetical protein
MEGIAILWEQPDIYTGVRLIGTNVTSGSYTW